MIFVPDKNQVAVEMPKTDVYYFDKEKEIESFTVLVDMVTKKVLKSAYKDRQRFVGMDIGEVISECKKEKYRHVKL
jgi:hypothetical protein